MLIRLGRETFYITMAKIYINLNPQKKDANVFIQKIVGYTPLIGLGAVLGLILVLIINVFILIRAGDYRDHKNEWKQWEGKFNSMFDIKNDISLLENEKRKIQGITVPRYQLAKISQDIFVSLPKNIWFDSLNFREEVLTLKGYVVRWGEDYLVSLDKFINSLKEKENFSSKFKKIDIKQSRKKEFRKVEVLEFTIEWAG